MATDSPLQTIKALADTALTQKKCAHQLDTRKGSYTSTSGALNAHYCGSNAGSKPSYVFWVSDADVDCDGAKERGACEADPTHQSETQWHVDGKPIDASTTPYVVINLDDDFRPNDVGILGVSVVAVLCAGQLRFAILGDSNPLGQQGEMSVKLAQQVRRSR